MCDAIPLFIRRLERYLQNMKHNMTRAAKDAADPESAKERSRQSSQRSREKASKSTHDLFLLDFLSVLALHFCCMACYWYNVGCFCQCSRSGGQYCCCLEPSSDFITVWRPLPKSLHAGDAGTTQLIPWWHNRTEAIGSWWWICSRFTYPIFHVQRYAS